MAKKISSTNTIKKKLKKALENQGNYIEGIEPLLELTAGNLYAYNLALRDVEELTQSFDEEMTREGNTKLVAHPSIKVLRDQSEILRRLLRELRLTLSTAEGISGDEMDKLIDSVNEIQ